ncbi:lysylphosphatidylglycerol synthase domain-containing protein [Streptomyces sp. V4-01]|uniref:Lysylphosphatidylglycerol synthase domain-containing protein n=1 Tax=Actinacidiphila polyblastidii TaxID=3110430 RepID=A0ABU7PEM3_9ACTN|nr:lysylphosphatidylglycerol synthase domain-containing protein [Streptomyces sp. V4-01]
MAGADTAGPGTGEPEAAEPDGAAAAAPRPRRGPSPRTLVGLLPAALVAAWVCRHRSLVAAGGRDLLAADRGWLLAALAATGLGWVANACARQGSVLERLPPVRLLITQFAATAAGQLAPAGLGASAVNLRFLRARGVPLARSSAALALYSLAESVGRVGLLLVLLLAFPHALRTGGPLPHGGALLAVAAAAVAALALLVAALAAIRPLRRAARGFALAALADARALHGRPSRALALWDGSVAFPVLQAAAMAAVATALRMPVPAAHVALAYLAATCLAAVVPTPGGIGAVDAALTVALVAAGSPTATAASAVLGFRVVTVWLPLVPAALALAALIRRRVL